MYTKRLFLTPVLYRLSKCTLTSKIYHYSNTLIPVFSTSLALLLFSFSGIILLRSQVRTFFYLFFLLQKMLPSHPIKSNGWFLIGKWRSALAFNRSDQFCCQLCRTKRQHVRIQRGDRGSEHPPPPKNHKAIEIFSNTGPDPMKNHKVN